MTLFLKFTFISAVLITGRNSEKKKLEGNPFAVTDTDVKGPFDTFYEDDCEIAVNDVESDHRFKRYANESVTIVGHGRIINPWYRSKRKRKPEDNEECDSKENGWRSNDNRKRHDSDDEDRSRPNDNRGGKKIKSFGGNCQVCGRMIGGRRGNFERVVNGRIVQPVFKYPWIVSLRKRPFGIFCGGAIISATFILTAGHCIINLARMNDPECNSGIPPKSCYFRPNEMSVHLLGRRQNGRTMPLRIVQIIHHKQFELLTLLHDVALIKLAAPIQCNQFSSPICLPTTNLHKLGGELIIAGWGDNTVEGDKGPKLLREGTMKQIRPQVCKRMVQGFINNPADIVCGIGTESKQSSCYGDSGSSIFAPFGNKVYTVGVSSRISGLKCFTDMPVVYMKVFRYMNWIKRYVKDLPLS